MTALNAEQIKRANEVLRDYLNAPADSIGRTPQQIQRERDKSRINVIDQQLRPLVDDFLSNDIDLGDFKRLVDSANKQNSYWGFKGIKGQMFFNILYNASDNLDLLADKLRASIRVPPDDNAAAAQINDFSKYVSDMARSHTAEGNDPRGAPKVTSVPFFLSYFWQIQNVEKWPVYYTNSVQTMEDLNLWVPKEDMAKSYLEYKSIHHQLSKLFCQTAHDVFSLYDVEHVFWFKGGREFKGDGAVAVATATTVPTVRENTKKESSVNTGDLGEGRLPDSYVPPIIAILPRVSLNDEALRKAAESSGTSLERAFEKSIDAAFKILGYESKLLGQGHGRVPDGVAIAESDSYAIIWDAKIRTGGYSIGTDDRVIKEYIATQSRDLKLKRRFRNIYYVVVSSGFSEDYDDTIKSIKMETDVSEVCLLEAAALVVMVERKLRDPNDVPLGPDGLQRLFSESGVLTAETVQTNFG